MLFKQKSMLIYMKSSNCFPKKANAIIDLYTALNYNKSTKSNSVTYL